MSYLVFIILPIIVISYFVFFQYDREKRDETIKLLKQSSYQAIVRLDNYILQIDEISKEPLYDDEILEDLKSLNNTSKVTVFDIENKFKKVLNRIILFNEDIYSVFIFNDSGVSANKFKDNSLYKEYIPINENWYNLCIEANGKTVIGPTKYNFDGYLASNNKEVKSFVIARRINDVESGIKKIGIIAIYTRINLLRKITNEIKHFPNERMLIIDNNENICYDTKETNIGKKISELDYKLYFDKEIKIGDVEYQSISVVSEVVDWKLIRLIPKRSLVESVNKTQNSFILITVIFVFISVLLSVYMAMYLNNPIKDLIEKMKLVETGDLTIRCSEKYDDEIGKIGRNFNKMMEEIGDLINRVYIIEVKKKEAENHFLQAQINPHFIYNTLESIRMVAEINDDEYVAKMTFLLGKLLRYSVNVNEQYVNVIDEIKHIKDYLYLQNIRFENKFLFNVNVDKNIMDTKIVKLTFQPIVENSIYYGFEDRYDNCIIKIKGYFDNNKRVFEIEDNGVGIHNDQLEKLNQNFKIGYSEVKASNGKGIGLLNINERIRLIYGEDFGLEIIKVEEGGTKVRIVLP